MADPLQVQRANTVLYCARWNATVAFYRDVLGLTIGFANDWFVEFRVGESAFVSIADASRATIESANGHGITLTWQVADIDESYEMLSGLGVALTPIRPRWGARVCYLRDPEGHRIELWTPDAGGAPVD